MSWLASALCPRCSGRGWCRVEDDACPCVARAEHADFEPEPQVLGEAAQERLEHRLRRVLIAGRRLDAVHVAAVLARAAARGSLPTPEQAARRVGPELAAPVLEVLGVDCSRRAAA